MDLYQVKMTPVRLRVFLFALFCAMYVSLVNGACAEVDSDTEAVAGQGFKLGCISCKLRGEVVATATVDWFFMSKGEQMFIPIYSYDGQSSMIKDDRFEDRLEWVGSRYTLDLQDASIYITNVTFNDTGVFRCLFNRILSYEHYEYATEATKDVKLSVVAKATRSTASIVSEVMIWRGGIEGKRGRIFSNSFRKQRQLCSSTSSRITQILSLDHSAHFLINWISINFLPVHGDIVEMHPISQIF
ncbi:hypothetical protein AALO_G00254260 [Alosa alosa]|uniref:Sodium channel regulatory subunit beta-1 n=1 Tax=Alosa alosa TaxID=278164 RepID=A0AAV6FNL6_9TELE|nr:hypothetical protein AALO_G00254260 [Alosa alosa]